LNANLQKINVKNASQYKINDFSDAYIMAFCYYRGAFYLCLDDELSLASVCLGWTCVRWISVG